MASESVYKHIYIAEVDTFFCLQGRVNAHGFTFISPDYRLVPPATGHTVLEDIKDLFGFLSKAGKIFTTSQQYEFEIDKDAIVVAGSSAGGLCAYLAAIHCDSPKPKAVLSIYGMGGDFLVSASALMRVSIFNSHITDTSLSPT